MPLIIPQLVSWGVSPSRREKEDGPSGMGVRLTEAIPAPVVWEGREVSLVSDFSTVSRLMLSGDASVSPESVPFEKLASEARKAFATAGSDNREVMLSHAFPES